MSSFMCDQYADKLGSVFLVGGVKVVWQYFSVLLLKKSKVKMRLHLGFSVNGLAPVKVEGVHSSTFGVSFCKKLLFGYWKDK